MVTWEEWEEEEAAWDDWADRVARNDPDWNFYPPGTQRPRRTWWQRLLRIAPPPITDRP